MSNKIPKGKYCQNEKGEPCNHLDLKYPPFCNKYTPLCIKGKSKPVKIEVRYILPEKIIRAFKCSACLKSSENKRVKGGGK